MSHGTSSMGGCFFPLFLSKHKDEVMAEPLQLHLILMLMMNSRSNSSTED
uniref:Predicted protein n=1 Tax=Hordeum vulgare subsp. vulgare TaxID=112509 RepID=F2DF95_HORVV|nr:predicted protein [Hordeum vulgare subsp. vulgare]